MVVVVKTPNKEAVAARDYRHYLTILVDGKQLFDAWDGEPEDSNLSRDFNACYSIPDLMELAYEAGKRGEEFTIKNVEESEEDCE